MKHSHRARYTAAHDSYPRYDEIRHRPTSGALRSPEYMWDWTVEANIQPDMYSLNDFNFENVQLSQARGLDAVGIALREPVSCACTGSNIIGEQVQELKVNKRKGLTEGGHH